MYSYHTESVWFIDKVLFFVAISLGAAVIIYSGTRERFKNSLNRPITGKWHRIREIIGLGSANSPDALDILKKTILNKDEDIAYFSMLSLGQIKNNASAGILLDFLGDHVFSGHRIVSLLESFPATIVEDVLKRTYSEDPVVRFWTVKLLSKFKPAQYAKRIEELAADDSADVRAAACECLSELGSRQARERLIGCLNDKMWFVRMHAVRALSKILGAECAADISDSLNDEAWLVRDSVKKAMIHNIEAFLPLIRDILRSYTHIAKDDCVEALQQSGYLAILLKNVPSQESMDLLEGVIKAGGHSGLESALSAFEPEQRSRIIGVIKGIDAGFGEHIDKKLNNMLNE